MKAVLFLTGILLLFATTPLYAAPICVDDDGDGAAAAADCGTDCEGLSGDCTLRDAIEKANTDSGADFIFFDPDVFPVDASTSIVLGNDLQPLLESLTIQGPGIDALVVDGDGAADIMFTIDSPTDDQIFEIRDITILHAGGPSSIGVAVLRGDTLNINHCLLSLFNGVSGAAVYNAGGTVTMDHCLVVQTAGVVGGIANDDDGSGHPGTLFITNSQIGPLNHSNFFGGGITNSGGSTLTVTDTLITGNTADNTGGGIANFEASTMTLLRTTVSNNAADFGGGIGNYESQSTLINSTVLNNQALNADALGGGVVNGGGGTLTVDDQSAIQGNVSQDRGGGVANVQGATVTISDSSIQGNTAGHFGGGLFNADTDSIANIIDSSVGNNIAANGAGLYHEGSDMMILGSTVSGNLADDEGGGLHYTGSGLLAVTNSTFSANNAIDAGGAIFCDNASEDNTITNSTIILNHSSIAAGIGNEGVGLGLANTIIALNNLDNCGGTFITLGHNLEDTDSCGLDDTMGDIIGVDPLLGPLQDNGGPTLTFLALEGSPVIDAGDDALAPDTDQRGAPRPIDGDGDGTAIADIGAVEAGCGDGTVDAGEECDDAGESILCNENCTEAACGDGITNVTAGEACDDGNTEDGDGCSGNCLEVEGDSDGDGVLDVNDNCPDDANADQADSDDDGLGDACDTESGGGGGEGSGGGCTLMPLSAADSFPHLGLILAALGLLGLKRRSLSS